MPLAVAEVLKELERLGQPASPRPEPKPPDIWWARPSTGGAGTRTLRASMPPERRPGFVTPERLEALERALVLLIALHSVVVGLFLTFATDWGARFGGFPSPVPLFFPRQAGAFHFVVAASTSWSTFGTGECSSSVMTKSIAVVFLGLTTLLDHVPWLVPLSGLGDLLMAGAVVLLRRARRLPLLGPAAGKAA